jgi:transcriptional regulator with XRE-family HTH domain
VVADPKPFRVRLTELRGEQGRTIEDVGLEMRALVRDREKGGDRLGASFSSYQKQAAGTAKSPPSMFLMEVVAQVLGISPWEFTEYQLAYYRKMLDERPPPDGVGPELAEVARRIVAEVLEPPRAGEDPVEFVDRAFEEAGLGEATGAATRTATRGGGRREGEERGAA